MISKYDIVMVLSIRAEQIRRGAEPRVVATSQRFDPIQLAVSELSQGKLPFVLTQGNGNTVPLDGYQMSDTERGTMDRIIKSMRHRNLCCFCLDAPRLAGVQGKAH